METIERDELKAQLDAGTDLKLVMAMHQVHFEKAHIPGSVQLFDLDQAGEVLTPDDRIVVYCSDRHCSASRLVGQKLIDAGYVHVIHYPGGLSDWLQAGYKLEGTAAE
jgi:rhodanese-related sulfurtransferase